MREIKFRAWDTIDKKMIYDANSDIKVYLNGSISMKGSWVDPEIFVLQYTGFKDKNGKEIYEGDILRKQLYHNGKKNGEQISLIKWADKIMFHGYPLPQGEIEVIGNIYENPELFKK